MPPEPQPLAAAPFAGAAALPAAWRAALVRLAWCWLVLLVLFRADWLAMVDQWWNSSTYNHIILIPAIIGWLVYLRAPELAKLTPRACWPALLPFGAAALVWVLGAFAGFNLAKQAALVGMAVAAVGAIMGPRVCAALAFPLAYSAFLVPFGDELVPLLQMITAKITIALVNASAIPAAIEGVFIDTPAGLFEVAEACSGVKFLVAMIAFGALVANVCFRTWPRRAAFMALCFVMPVLTNGVRAWGTIYVAQFKGAAYAGGVDHIIYGWVFFAVVIALTMAIAWRFFDRAVDDAMIDGAAIAASPLLGRWEARAMGPLKAAGAIGLLAIAASLWAGAADRLAAPLPPRIDLPQVAGWTRVDYAPSTWWEPRAGGADHRLLGRYADGKGRKVDVFYALYAKQSEGREAGGFGEGALRPESGWSWQGPGPALADGKAERLQANTREVRLAETYYRTGSLVTGSNMALKLANIGDRLVLRAVPTQMLILSAEGADGEVALAAFRQSTGPLGPWMDRVGGVR